MNKLNIFIDNKSQIYTTVNVEKCKHILLLNKSILCFGENCDLYEPNT